MAELVLSVGSGTILMGGMTSAPVIASRAADSTSDDCRHILEARGCADQILAELNDATAFTEQGSRSLAFLVLDHDGDKSAEEIRYSWSSNADEALTRDYNGGAPMASAEAVQGFELSYLSRLFPAASYEEFAARFFAYDGSLSGSLKDRDIDYDSWCAQYFKPDLPTNTVSWKSQLSRNSSPPGGGREVAQRTDQAPKSAAEANGASSSGSDDRPPHSQGHDIGSRKTAPFPLADDPPIDYQ